MRDKIIQGILKASILTEERACNIADSILRELGVQTIPVYWPGTTILKTDSTLREGTLRPASPDPGFWVRYNGLKFYGDGYGVSIEGYNKDYSFHTLAPVKILHSYPFGVRADDEDGNSYLITGGPEPAHMYIAMLTQGDVSEIDSGRFGYSWYCDRSARKA